MICTESGKQYILVLPVKIHCQMNYWMLDKHPSLKKQTDALLDTYCFFNFDTHYFHGVVFILLTPLKIRSYEMDKVFLCTFIIYFFKSLSYKGSYKISWIYYNLYHIYNISRLLPRHNVFGYQKPNVKVLRNTVHEDTSV